MMPDLPSPLDDLLSRLARFISDRKVGTIYSRGGPYNYRALFAAYGQEIVDRLKLEISKLDKDLTVVSVPPERFGSWSPLLVIVVCSVEEAKLGVEALLRGRFRRYLISTRPQPSSDVVLMRMTR